MTRGFGHGDGGDSCTKAFDGLHKTKPVVCGFGCGTPIFKDHTINKWIEYNSGAIHSTVRCQKIIEKRKQDRELGLTI